ncbi:zinc-dependent alcohol dehydrogenase family protein [Ramlibacter rhizophilus]|uniref:Zinc-binding alcohol dehydrogenase family protein n=1 Tax=Ramlibacter rhizophilus TaxID=1781167 RepID=A0A4Z0C1K1_9BURK|nr:zinc-binding alcohol dehydrogenase family protein [Ramlibacter rhizophilus]
MRAMAADPSGRRLVEVERPVPRPGPHELLLQVLACGVCRTDLHLIDGDLPPHGHLVVPGHEVVGRVVALGSAAHRFARGQRVGVPWLGGTCGVCPYCSQNRENLCDRPVFTGWDRDGGFAEYVAADERFCFALPERYDDLHAAPLLCAGLIGHRAWRMAGKGVRRLGLYGFGAAAHLLAQLAVAQGQRVYAFTRAGDARSQAFARSLGAAWAGSADTLPPEPLDAALLFAPAGELVPLALRAVRKAGTVVCAGIHMSDIPSFPYSLLWGERCVRSVANLTRADGEDFLRLASGLPLQASVQAFALADAAQAVQSLREGRLDGAAVLVPHGAWLAGDRA